MTTSENPAFSRVLAAFRSRLSSQDIHGFQSTTFEEVKGAIIEIQKQQAQRRGFRNLKKIRPFLNGLGQYASVIEVFVNTSDILAFIWGPIKFCLQIASKLTEAFDALLDAYERLGKSLPLFTIVDQLFLSHTHVQQVLVDVYEDLLDFHKRAIVFFKQGLWRLAFRVTIHSFGDMFGDVIKKLERSKELLLQSASIAHFQDAQEGRLLFTQEFEAQLERTKQDRMLAVIDWLSPVSSYVDHEELQKKRREFPHTTRWIFEEPSMQNWLHTNGKSSPVFWICGIPGAGKTVLFSSIVDEINETMPESQVVFFYCKNRDPLKNTFGAVARSLIAQLLRLNPLSLDYLYQTAVESGERSPSTFKTYTEILENISTTHGLLFIGIDGLDECEQVDRCLILSLIEHLSKSINPQADVKFFLTSQRMKDLDDSLRSVTRFDIRHRHVSKDIQNYVHTRSCQLFQKFALGHEKQRAVTLDICSRPKGMFLLARLIMDNLIDQDNVEDLEEELDTDTLPHGIDEAYGRILKRLHKGRPEKRQQRAARVLEIVVTARYPLKVHEVQGALSIRVEDMTVDFPKRRSLTPFSELCGPIIEIHADNTISLVHPTAKQYLLQHYSGPYIDQLAAELRMANLCATYLMSEFFSSGLQPTKVQDHANAGVYAFQEYAATNWFYHAETVLNANLSIDSGELSALKRSCTLLQARHYTGDLSIDGVEHGNQNLLVALTQIRRSYEIVKSISDCDDCGDPVPYLLKDISWVRSVIEELSTADSCHGPLLAEAYGAYVFKCPILACSRFQHGFKTRKERDDHQKLHLRPFVCTYGGCDYSILGFSTSQELVKHLLVHAPMPDEVIFPKVQRCSLKKLLEDAIDKDDSISVRALAVEVLASPTREVGFLLQAIKKGSRKAAAIIMEVLGTTEEINYTDRSGKSSIRFIAETGDDEMAKLFIAAGADMKARTKKGDTSLTIATLRGHEKLVRLLLNQYAWSFDVDVYSLKESLRLAAAAGHKEILKLLLDKHGVAYTQDQIYYKAIQEAASREQKSTLRLLLERGRELNAERTYATRLSKIAKGDVASMVKSFMPPSAQEMLGWEKLPVAALEGDSRQVLRLLEDGADIDYYSKRYGTALMAAAGNGHLSVVQQLLDKEADVNAPNGGTVSALQKAASYGDEAVVSLLLTKQAAINLSDSFSGTALCQAAGNGHEAIVRLLLEWKAEVNTKVSSSGTALYQAVRNGHEVIVDLLLHSEADVNAKDRNSYTVLHRAACDGQEAMVRQLLEWKAEINEKDVLGATALHQAVSSGHEAIVDLLLHSGADVNAKDRNGHTALHQAACDGQEAMVRRLLEWKAEINEKDVPGATALHQAVSSGHEAIVDLLLHSGADVNAKDRYSYTALHQATCDGQEAMVRRLLEGKADVNGKGAIRSTALHFAARGGHRAIAILLLEGGADVNIKDDNGDTALQYASAFGRKEIADLLLEWGAEGERGYHSWSRRRAPLA